MSANKKIDVLIVINKLPQSSLPVERLELLPLRSAPAASLRPVLLAPFFPVPLAPLDKPPLDPLLMVKLCEVCLGVVYRVLNLVWARPPIQSSNRSFVLGPRAPPPLRKVIRPVYARASVAGRRYQSSCRSGGILCKRRVFSIVPNPATSSPLAARTRT